MMCALWTLLFLALVGLALTTLVGFRAMVLSRDFDSVAGFEERRGRGCTDRADDTDGNFHNDEG